MTDEKHTDNHSFKFENPEETNSKSAKNTPSQESENYQAAKELFEDLHETLIAAPTRFWTNVFKLLFMVIFGVVYICMLLKFIGFIIRSMN